MAYSDFSLREVVETFDLKLSHVPDLFPDAPEVPPGPILDALLPEFLPVARMVGTEKGRSELLIAPILMAVRAHLRHQISFFSGHDLTVDESQGLVGTCDFILSRSPIGDYLCSPVAVIVEAKRADISLGLGQCAAAMVGARQFNENEGKAGQTIHGVVTTGLVWNFLRLASGELALGDWDYSITELPRLLGALVRMVSG